MVKKTTGLRITQQPLKMMPGKNTGMCLQNDVKEKKVRTSTCHVSQK